ASQVVGVRGQRPASTSSSLRTSVPGPPRRCPRSRRGWARERAHDRARCLPRRARRPRASRPARRPGPIAGHAPKLSSPAPNGGRVRRAGAGASETVPSGRGTDDAFFRSKRPSTRGRVEEAMIDVVRKNLDAFGAGDWTAFEATLNDDAVYVEMPT